MLNYQDEIDLAEVSKILGVEITPSALDELETMLAPVGEPPLADSELIPALKKLSAAEKKDVAERIRVFGNMNPGGIISTHGGKIRRVR
jgi:hypothetical protein